VTRSCHQGRAADAEHAVRGFAACPKKRPRSAWIDCPLHGVATAVRNPDRLSSDTHNRRVNFCDDLVIPNGCVVYRTRTDLVLYA
jgi:hypothetical protein